MMHLLKLISKYKILCASLCSINVLECLSSSVILQSIMLTILFTAIFRTHLQNRFLRYICLQDTKNSSQQISSLLVCDKFFGIFLF